MAKINGYKLTTGPVGRLKDTGYLDGLIAYRGADLRLLRVGKLHRARLNPHRHQNPTQGAKAYVVPNYYADLYKRILVIPHLVNLGSISTEQRFDVQVWNANREAVKLQSVSIEGGEGIEFNGPANPVTFNGLALKKWSVKVGMTGPAQIDCLVTFKFVGKNPVTLRILGSRSTDWAFAPDWSESVTENLEFLTRVHQSLSGAEQRIALRITPRRTFEFKVTMTDVARQQFESALYAYGSRVWSMPVFTDCAHLNQSVKAGDTTLHFNTTGYDFFAGGRAVLVSGTQKEMVELITVEADKCTVKRPIAASFDKNWTEVYPLRSAVLTDMPPITRLSDGVSTAQVRLQIHEHNPYSADIAHLSTYRNHPVLEPTSEWSEDITAQYQRLIKSLDNQSGLPYYLDVAQKAFQVTSHRFVAVGREEQRLLRQLFYYLRGRQKAIWVATASTDITPVADITGKSIDIAAIGYVSALQNQVGRRDVRIECKDGQVYYRRILSSGAIDEHTERLGLDGEPLGIKLADVAKISWLTLSRLESDTVRFEHQTDADGTALITVSFRGVRDELEL